MPDAPPKNNLVQKTISDSSRALQKARNDSLEASRKKILKMQHDMDSIKNAMLLAKNDSLKSAMLKKANSLSDSINKIKSDSLHIAQQLAALKSSFSYAPKTPQYVAILMNKVDPVYVSETKNAFNRYNQENFYNKTFDISITQLNDSMRMVLINGFANSDEALDYMDQAKKHAAREIVPWLPVAKYSFLIFTNDNLELLKNNKDIPGYRKFLNASYPGKF
jgi:hypothetical protein